jgi:hypothetical protein
MSAKGLKAIVRTMRDDKRERMPGLLPQAMAEELPPEGDDARDAGEALAGCAPVGLSRRPTTDRQGACVRTLAEMGVAAHQRFASSGPRAPPDLASATHSTPETFLARFRDMSTKRLHGYLPTTAVLSQQDTLLAPAHHPVFFPRFTRQGDRVA